MSRTSEKLPSPSTSLDFQTQLSKTNNLIFSTNALINSFEFVKGYSLKNLAFVFGIELLRDRKWLKVTLDLFLDLQSHFCL